MSIKRKFRKRLIRNIQKTPPLVLMRVFSVAVLLFPAWVVTLIVSLLRAYRWRKIKTCQQFIERNCLAFQDVDPSTLSVTQIFGGVSNLSEIWRFRKSTGTDTRYFAKVFLPLGSLWATVNAWASPFPHVRARKSEERFVVDMVSRTELADRGIPVPKLIAYDAVEKVMVTEYLKGNSVDDVLKRIQRHGEMDEKDRTVIRKCGEGLGKAHAAGFSLVDTQPINCIWVPSRMQVYFIDLEFCTRDDKRVWDVGFFLAFLTARLEGNIAREARGLFLESYQKERHINLTEMRATSEQLKKYIPVFQTILDIRQFTPEELLAELLS